MGHVHPSNLLGPAKKLSWATPNFSFSFLFGEYLT